VVRNTQYGKQTKAYCLRLKTGGVMADSLRKEAILLVLLLLILLTVVILLIAFKDLPIIHELDNRILLGLRKQNDSTPLGPSWLLRGVQETTVLGGALVLSIVSLSTAGCLLLHRHYRLLVSVLSSIIGGTLFSLCLKQLIHRPRPAIVTHFDYSIITNSFPSGHSMLSAIVYLTVAILIAQMFSDRITKIYVFAVAGSLIGLIGFTRIYLGVHYLSDVLAGWCFGGVWVILWYFLIEKYLQVHRVRGA